MAVGLGDAMMSLRDPRAVMSEDELMAGLTEALELAGWRWMHIIRSDGVTQGDPGWLDLVAVHPMRPGSPILVWEAKGTGGKLSGDQAAWMAALIGASREGVDVRVIDPTSYDRALGVILYGDLDSPWPD